MFIVAFFFKKNLCDLWDSFFYIAVCNLFSLIAVFISGFLLTLVPTILVRTEIKDFCVFIVIIFGCFLFSLVYFSTGKNATRISNSNFPRYVDFFLGFRNSIVDAVLLGSFIGMLICAIIVSLPYYLLKWEETRRLYQAFFATVIFWFLISTFFALQWFLGVKSFLGTGFFKCLKKCYILFFDNLDFTFVLFLINLANLLVTVLTFGIFPGLAGIAVTNVNAFRLILQKYYWLEKQQDFPRAKNRKIPWNELLSEDIKILKNRTVMGLFFPWVHE